MTIAQLQGRVYKFTKCENKCKGNATHYDIRTGDLYCQPHAFAINRDYRKEIT